MRRMLPPLLIHINSYPGVGKLTIGRKVASELGAKLLDNHSIYNVAFALTEFKSDEFYHAVRDVRSTAYRIAATLPPEVPIILTNAHDRIRTGATSVGTKPLILRGKLAANTW